MVKPLPLKQNLENNQIIHRTEPNIEEQLQLMLCQTHLNTADLQIKQLTLSKK